MTDLCRWAATPNVFTINTWNQWWDASIKAQDILKTEGRLVGMTDETGWTGPGTYRLLVLDERSKGQVTTAFRFVRIFI